MFKKIATTILAVLGLCSAIYAQDVEVKGTVTDQAGEPVVGASIIVEGTTNGTSSDVDGAYSLKVPSNATLTVSSIGFQDQKIQVNGRTQIDIVMREDSQSLDGVIVVAFGTAKKDAYTGSATVIKSDDIAKSQQSNVAQTLAGKVAGVQIANTSGQPGSSPSIRIRGIQLA